jgi:hypothetical protein
MFMLRTSVQTMKYAANWPAVIPCTEPPCEFAIVVQTTR